MLARQAGNVGTNCLEKRCCIIDSCVFFEGHAKTVFLKKMNNNSNDFLFVTPKHLGALKKSMNNNSNDFLFVTPKHLGALKNSF